MQRLLRTSIVTLPSLKSRSLHISPPTLYAVRPASHTVGYKAGPDPPDIRNDLNAVADDIQAEADKKEAESLPAARYKGFKEGQEYKPFDFKKNRRLDKPQRQPQYVPRFGPGARLAAHNDPFLHLDIDPLKEAMNDALLSRFLTTMGKIKRRNETGLSRKSQRRIGKAVRRARSMGILPMMSRPITSEQYRSP
ncbi:uncharacterized protein EI90DRAFT_1719932 [Cantharellus anzutake]|uniref:uncharacterized protein n=1 Tax=Cantharellus anzutake TaxID=1750568 RepID=UPI001906B23E|nr:uncharacterized protein EI90DRAFT_1719932 [Cantharellus anzutake]KAF8341309.1 hypothetical protein EI90DRAFT_1719932 [Cantharellus anzutake]